MFRKHLKLLLIISVFASLLMGARPAAAALCKVGDSASVLWGGKWWPATVLSVNKAGTKCKIRYKGYSSKWDEWVGASRIRILSASSAKKSGYYSGQSVKVLWGKKWWNARVLKVSGNRYKIHYDGYGSKWDEWVGPSRIRKR